MIAASNSNATRNPFTKIAENLYRHNNGMYYCLFKKNGKQFRKSLKTSDPALARRRRDEERDKVERLATADARKMPFANECRPEMCHGHRRPVKNLLREPVVDRCRALRARA